MKTYFISKQTFLSFILQSHIEKKLKMQFFYKFQSNRSQNRDRRDVMNKRLHEKRFFINFRRLSLFSIKRNEIHHVFSFFLPFIDN